MLRKIKKYIDKWDMLEAGDRVITGVSGGADSVCLLLVLVKLREIIPFELVVVHVNHGLRGEAADGDEAYVKALCEKYQIPCVVYLENVELIAKKRKQSLEEAGREVRREAFRKTLEKYNGTKIALAHHQNDNAETFLMNLSRGSGLAGLRGILPVNGNVIRPLLSVGRKDIEQYLEEQGILYCTDETNKSDEYTRNRVRNHVIPYLEGHVNAKVVSHMNEAMEKLGEVQAYLEEQAEHAWRDCVRMCGTGYLVEGEAFGALPSVIKPLVLKRTLKELTGKEKDITTAHLQDIQELFEKQAGRRIDLPYETAAERVYEGVEFRKKGLCLEGEREAKELNLKEGESGEIDWYGVKIRYQVFERGSRKSECSEKTYTKWFDYDIIKDTVNVRMRKPGDYITIHQDGKTQKLKSFFINEKIPREKRGEIPLIAEGNHVLWIVGYRAGSAYRISEHTKRVLEIQINKGE